MAGRVGRTIGVLLGTWGVAVVTLWTTRPHPVGAATTWSGDEVARIACWAVGVAYTGWLTLTTLACSIAIARHGATGARRVLRWAPPVAHRVLRAALAGTLAVAPPAPPVTLHLGPDGRLSGNPEPAPTRPTTPTTGTTRPSPAPRRSVPRPHPVRPRRHCVEVGDNLWTIARSELARRAGRVPDDRDVARYWLRVIAANRATLRSGDPSLIYPGEIVTLPNP